MKYQSSPWRPCRLAPLLVGIGLLSACSHPTEPVNSPETAIASAKSAWASVRAKKEDPIYSTQSTARFEPYIATLQGDEWIVRGTIPPNYHGEVLVTKIRRKDGTILISVEQSK